jgi:hypothetical protein
MRRRYCSIGGPTIPQLLLFLFFFYPLTAAPHAPCNVLIIWSDPPIKWHFGFSGQIRARWPPQGSSWGGEKKRQKKAKRKKTGTFIDTYLPTCLPACLPTADMSAATYYRPLLDFGARFDNQSGERMTTCSFSIGYVAYIYYVAEFLCGRVCRVANGWNCADVLCYPINGQIYRHVNMGH